jgi:hypothetical protein
MTNHYLIVCFLLLSGCAQQIYNTQLEIRNDCSNLISSTIDGFSNRGTSNDPVNILIEPSQTVRVGTFVGFNNRLEESLPDNYKITIKNNGLVTTIDRSGVLSQAIENLEKNTKDKRFWLLNTKRICQ